MFFLGEFAPNDFALESQENCDNSIKLVIISTYDNDYQREMIEQIMQETNLKSNC